MNDQQRLQIRNDQIGIIINTESKFNGTLTIFMDSFLNLMSLRDTEFKRAFMNDPYLALTFNQFLDIYQASTEFFQKIQQWSAQGGSDPHALAEIFESFSPCLLLYARYTSTNSDALNSLANFSSGLKKHFEEHPLPLDSPQALSTVEEYLLHPIKQYPLYLSVFEVYVKATPQSYPESAALTKGFFHFFFFLSSFSFLS